MFETLTLLSAVAATTTSQIVDLSGRRAISLQYITPTHSAGNVTFSAEVSNDNSNWQTYNMLVDNVTNTNAQNLTRVASKILSSATNDFVFFDPFTNFKYLRATANIADTATATIKLFVVYD